MNSEPITHTTCVKCGHGSFKCPCRKPKFVTVKL
jgi:predicted molibdopterin-dependent oxidoreductase YjgC